MIDVEEEEGREGKKLELKQLEKCRAISEDFSGFVVSDFPEREIREPILLDLSLILLDAN